MADSDSRVVISIFAYFAIVFVLFSAFGIADSSLKLPLTPKGTLGNGTSEEEIGGAESQQGFFGTFAECLVTTAPFSVFGAVLGAVDAFITDVPWIDCDRGTIGPVGGIISGLSSVAEIFVFIFRLAWDFIGFLWQFATFGYPEVPAFITVLFCWMPSLVLLMMWYRYVVSAIGSVVPG